MAVVVIIIIRRLWPCSPLRQQWIKEWVTEKHGQQQRWSSSLPPPPLSSAVLKNEKRTKLWHLLHPQLITYYLLPFYQNVITGTNCDHQLDDDQWGSCVWLLRPAGRHSQFSSIDKEHIFNPSSVEIDCRRAINGCCPLQPSTDTDTVRRYH